MHYKKIKIGHPIIWVSQANGVEKTKLGTVVAHIKKGNHPKEHPAVKTGFWKTSSSMQNYEEVDPRNEDSYLVSVKEESIFSRPKLYWPRTSAFNKYFECLEEVIKELEK